MQMFAGAVLAFGIANKTESAKAVIGLGRTLSFSSTLIDVLFSTAYLILQSH